MKNLCPALFTLLSISLFYYLYFYTYSNNPIPSSLSILCIFHILLFLSCLSLIQIIILNPGRVPKSFSLSSIPEYEKLPYTEEIVSKYYLLGRVGYCTDCKIDKPHRSHHCKACNSCIMRYEHHCVFIGMCIGLKNVKLFVLFLFYSTLACLCVFVHCSLMIIELEFSWGVVAMDLLAGVLAVMFLGLWVVQMAGVCWNVTGSEFKWRVRDMFDVGVVGNVQQVFGETLILWFVPVESCGSDGLRFPMKIKYKDRNELEAVGKYLI